MVGNLTLARFEINERSEGKRVVEDDIEEGAVHVQPAFVMNEAKFANLFRKKLRHITREFSCRR